MTTVKSTSTRKEAPAFMAQVTEPALFSGTLLTMLLENANQHLWQCLQEAGLEEELALFERINILRAFQHGVMQGDSFTPLQNKYMASSVGYLSQYLPEEVRERKKMGLRSPHKKFTTYS